MSLFLWHLSSGLTEQLWATVVKCCREFQCLTLLIIFEALLFFVEIIIGFGILLSANFKKALNGPETPIRFD